MVQVAQIDHIALSVTDLALSEAWYREHLGLERRFAELWDGPPVMMAAGGTALALFPADDTTTAAGVAPIRMLHLAFRVDAAGFQDARTHLAQAGIQHREAEHENCRSLYFADPDGHKLELTTYDEVPTS